MAARRDSWQRAEFVKRSPVFELFERYTRSALSGTGDRAGGEMTRVRDQLAARTSRQMA
jgi:hypothetical protein